MNHCVRHYEESMAGTCRSCQAPFCSRCLVYAFGPKKPPYCIGCALNAGGVRNGYKVTPMAPMAADPAAGPSVPATTIDRKAEKAAAKAAAKAEKAAAKARRGRGKGGQGGGDPVPAPLPPAAGGTPIPFDAGWSDEEHDARVPATAQLASLMRSRSHHRVGQSI